VHITVYALSLVVIVAYYVSL